MHLTVFFFQKVCSYYLLPQSHNKHPTSHSYSDLLPPSFVAHIVSANVLRDSNTALQNFILFLKIA